MTIPQAKRRSSAANPGEPQNRATLWPPPRGGWTAIAGIALIYTAHWFYGALVTDTAMAMNIAAAIVLGGVLLSPSLRQDLLRLKGLGVPALLFGVVLLVALYTLTPWTPGGPHPIWKYVGVGGAASTVDKSATIVETIKLLGLGCVFLIGAATGARDERARYAIRLLIFVGVLFGLWAFVAAMSGALQSIGRRLEAHFLNANTAGGVFAILAVLAVAEASRVTRSSTARRPLAVLLRLGPPAVFLVCLLDTASRGAAASFLGGVLAYTFFRLISGQIRFSRALAAGMAGILALIALVAVAGSSLIDRLFEAQGDSILRTEVWRAHWHAFLSSPLFGYGLGSAETVNKSLLAMSNFDVLWSIRAILNVYLQWLEETGLVGAIPMFLCLAVLMVRTIQGLLRRQRMTNLLAGLLAADVVVLIHGAMDFGLEVWSVAALWSWLLGLQFSVAQGSSSR